MDIKRQREYGHSRIDWYCRECGQERIKQFIIKPEHLNKQENEVEWVLCEDCLKKLREKIDDMLEGENKYRLYNVAINDGMKSILPTSQHEIVVIASSQEDAIERVKRNYGYYISISSELYAIPLKFQEFNIKIMRKEGDA